MFFNWDNVFGLYGLLPYLLGPIKSCRVKNENLKKSNSTMTALFEWHASGKDFYKHDVFIPISVSSNC